MASNTEITIRYMGEYRLEYPKLHVLFEIAGKPEWCVLELRDDLSEAEIAEVTEKMETLKDTPRKVSVS